MNKENTEYLWNKYPKIFRDKNADIRTSAIPFGFECRDGWYKLIDLLCSNIQNHIDYNNVTQVVATQVKEKFGGLRFYYTGGDLIIFGMVRIIEDISNHTCEYCGSNKQIGKTTGWIKTICKDCVINNKIENWSPS